MHLQAKGAAVNFNVSSKTSDDIRAVARTLIATGKTHLPLLTPRGTSMMTVTTDPSLLSYSLMEFVVDETTIYVGFEK